MLIYQNSQAAIDNLVNRGFAGIFVSPDSPDVAFGDRDELPPGHWDEVSEYELVNWHL